MLVFTTVDRQKKLLINLRLTANYRVGQIKWHHFTFLLGTN